MLMHCPFCLRDVEIHATFHRADNTAPAYWELEMSTCPECGSVLEVDDQPTVPLNPMPSLPGKAQRRPAHTSKTKFGGMR